MPQNATILCSKCGSPNDETARFCEQCGTSLREHCPKCGETVRASQKFCRTCGYPFSVLPAGSRPQAPEHLVTRISPVDEERKVATILFADIANSTEIIRDLDAEEARHFLLPAVGLMADAVHRYEGIVVRERGDGIMASFGAPVALEDHAARACYAALDMQKAISARAEKTEREFGFPLKMRIGINSGIIVVTVRSEDGELREIRVDGVPTHIASRLEPLATPGTILVSRATADLAAGYIRVRPLGAHALKGIQDPVEVYQLDGVRTRQRIHALATRGLSKFVGREHEIETLGRLAAHARTGRGQVVALVGEAGVGKSRLFLEFVRSEAIGGWLVLEAGSVSYGKASSYLPVVDLLTRYFEIDPVDKEETVRDRIRLKLESLGEDKLSAQTPVFLGILGMGLGDHAWTNLTPAERQSTIFGALKRLLMREAQRQPLCVLFEDLHWIDAETHAFLDMLLESIPAARLLLLVNYRPDYQSGWTGKTFFSQVRIDSLQESSADEMLDVLLGPDPRLGPIKNALIELTEGNPLFLEESVRSLFESGIITGRPGAWQPLRGLPAGFVPKTIEALLAARIDRLAPEHKELLQCAAVIGSDVPQPLLAAVAGASIADIDQRMRVLQAGEFVYEKTLFPETAYTFKHSMTREVAYAGLLRERRMTLHARAARAILALAGGRVQEHVEALAQHAEAGGLWDLAVEYLERAGTKAFRLYANSEAAVFFERALAVIAHLPETRATREQAVDLRFELRNALIALCELDRIRHCLDELETLLAALGDKVRSARHAAFRCNHHFLAGEQFEAIRAGEQGLALARECGATAVEGELLYRIGQSYFVLGQNRTARALLERSLEVTGEEHVQNRFELSVLPSVVNRTWLVEVLTECGMFRSALGHAKRALDIAENAEHPLSQVLGWLAIGRVLLRKGELDGAIGAFERGMALCNTYALPIWRLRLLSSLGVAYAYSGRTDKALELTTQAVTGAERMHLIVDTPMFLISLGESRLLGGCAGEASLLAKRALDIARAHDDLRGEAWAQLLLGRARDGSDLEGPLQPQQALEAALELARASEARPLEGLCQSVLAEIHAAAGDESGAEACRHDAGAVFAELDMRPLAAPAS